jgi:paraquat-inducible protein B
VGRRRRRSGCSTTRLHERARSDVNDPIPNQQREEPDNGKPRAQAPTARVKRRASISPIWLVPLVAAGIAAYLAVHAFVTRGPLITITFKTAAGLTAHQTEVRHKAVKLGTVDEISLSKDMSYVVVHVRMDATAKPILTDHARFWVVRPRLSGVGLAGLQSGLETLVSGAYIAVDPGEPKGRPIDSWKGLEEPPSVRSDEPGRVFQLRSSRLGALGPGAPVFYRDVTVGEVLSYGSGQAVGPVSIRIFVRAPFDALIQTNTHFWNSSGLSLDMGPSGLHLEFQSLQSVLSGGISFESPPDAERGEPADTTRVFDLYDNRATAEADFFERVPCITYVESSISGLAIGAPVQLRGVQMGVVTGERLVLNQEGRVVARVAFDMQPTRALEAAGRSARDLTTFILSQGVHVEVTSTNLVTGQQVLSLQYSGGAHKTDLRSEGDVLVLPGQAGGIADVTHSLSEIATKLNQVPFDDIGKNVDRTLRSVADTVNGPKMQNALNELTTTLQEVRRLAHDVDAGMAPALARLPKVADQMQQAAQKLNAALGEAGYGQSSDFQRNMAELVAQARDAARSIHLFVDYLDRHPEALIRGRSEGESP